MATFTNRINDLIDTAWTSLNSESDIFNSAVAEVADMVFPAVLLKYAVDPLNLDASPTSTGIEEKKVLLVTRSDGAVERESREVSIPQFTQAQEAASIHFATEFTPVYCLITDGGTTELKVFPLTTDSRVGKVYYFGYPTTDITGTSSIDGMPTELLQAVVLRACIKLLQGYISDAVQTEEDSEVQQQITAQIAGLQAQFQEEIARFSQGAAE